MRPRCLSFTVRPCVARSRFSRPAAPGQARKWRTVFVDQICADAWRAEWMRGTRRAAQPSLSCSLARRRWSARSRASGASMALELGLYGQEARECVEMVGWRRSVLWLSTLSKAPSSNRKEARVRGALRCVTFASNAARITGNLRLAELALRCQLGTVGPTRGDLRLATVLLARALLPMVGAHA